MLVFYCFYNFQITNFPSHRWNLAQWFFLHLMSPDRDQFNLLPQSSGRINKISFRIKSWSMHFYTSHLSHPEILIRTPIWSSKKLPYPSEILIRRNFCTPCILIRTKLYQEVNQEISRNAPETLSLDPERHFIDPGRKFGSSRWLR